MTLTHSDIVVGIIFLCVFTALFFRKKSYVLNPKEEFDRMNHEYLTNGCFMDENGILKHDVDELIYRWEAINGKETTIIKVINKPVLQEGNYDGSGY
jgi:hypothetical protein